MLDLIISLVVHSGCFNRHYAEHSGYFTSKTSFLQDVDRTAETTYYDSSSGRPLFIAPRGRSFEAFLRESQEHGWPSFRDEEVVWDNVRCLSNGEAVSVDGTHVSGMRLRCAVNPCYNLVSDAISCDVIDLCSWATISQTRRATATASTWCLWLALPRSAQPLPRPRTTRPAATFNWQAAPLSLTSPHLPSPRTSPVREE